MVTMLMKLVFLVEDFLLEKMVTLINQHSNQTIVQMKNMMIQKSVLVKYKCNFFQVNEDLLAESTHF